MAGYIDADKLIDFVRNNTPNIDGETTLQCVERAISEAPAADVAEVKHEHWCIIEYEYFTCSGCGDSCYNGCECTAQAKEKLKNGETPNYCPHCGAKMDGGDGE